MTIHDYYGQKNGLLVLSMFLFYFCSRFIYNLIKVENMEVYYIEAEIFENIMDRIENLSTHVDHLCKKTEEKKLGE